MLLRSQFRPIAFLPAILLFPFTIALIVALIILLDTSTKPDLGEWIFFILFFFAWLALAFGELRTRAFKVSISDEGVIASNYMGLGSKRIFNFSELSGFTTKLISTRHDIYEYLYLEKNDKKVITLSEFYHGNYKEMKEALATKLPDLAKIDPL